MSQPVEAVVVHLLRMMPEFPEELWGKFASADLLDEAVWRHEQLLRQDRRAVEEEIQLNF